MWEKHNKKKIASFSLLYCMDIGNPQKMYLVTQKIYKHKKIVKNSVT